MNSNTIASANAALIGSVDWDRVDAQSIIDAMKKGEIRGPLTEWLARKGWLAEMLATPEPQVTIDPIIRVDRSIKPNYPNWMKEVLHPDLEKSGPNEYDITTIDQWLHEGQKNGGWIEGNKIYTHLKETDTLKTCLGLRDLEEIQKKGIKFFRKYFKGKVVFGWAGCVRCRNGRLGVPFLYVFGGKVVLSWVWTVGDWNDDDPALRHAS